jgi:phytoene dehydrogenase-like protein
LGGIIEYNAKVINLITENNNVKGVILEDGREVFAERVLSAADGRFTLQKLLGKSEEEGDINAKDVSDQPVQVNLGVNEDFSNEKGPITYILDERYFAAGREHNKMTIHNKFYDPDAAPKGKSAVTAFLDSDYNWWKEISNDPSRYKLEKDRCAKMVIDIIGKYHPGFEDRVEVIDVSTPLTRERYTGNFMGAMQAKKPDSNMIKALIQSSPKYEYKGIKGVFLAGQWVEAWGGITTAAQSGRKAVKLICKKDNIEFFTSKA